MINRPCTQFISQVTTPLLFVLFQVRTVAIYVSNYPRLHICTKIKEHTINLTHFSFLTNENESLTLRRCV